MTALVFLAGVLTGMIGLTLLGLIYLIRFSKRRRALYAKAAPMWDKAGELFETAKIWHAIGDEKTASDALAEAQRLAKEAERIEDEADGRHKTP